MTEEELHNIERDIAFGRKMPGVSRYPLDTMTTLIAEVRRLQQEVAEWKEGSAVEAHEADAARAEVRRLQDALLKYGQHEAGCVFWQDDDSDFTAYGPGGCCTCEYYDATH